MLLFGGNLKPATGLNLWPRYGMSIANMIVSKAQSIKAIVAVYVSCGVQLTRVNLLSALWQGVDCLPFKQNADGTWDLYNWNQEYFDRVAEVRERMNAAGIVVMWTLLELYSWSRRKDGPQQNGTPWRYNVNGVYWNPEDVTFDVLPDAWIAEFLKKVIPYLGLNVNVLEIGNEFPEKALHERVLAIIRRIQPNALISVNRNEDTPGQYLNMRLGKALTIEGAVYPGYDFLALHGRLLKSIAPIKNGMGQVIRPQGDLDRIYEHEPVYRTFNQFFLKCPHDPKRIIFSSDGARSSDSPTNTYDWGELREFFQEMKRRGCSIEHQSRAKMTPAPNHHMIEADWFRSVIA